MSRKAIAVVIIALLALGATAFGGGRWLVQKIRVMHGAH